VGGLSNFWYFWCLNKEKKRKRKIKEKEKENENEGRKERNELFVPSSVVILLLLFFVVTSSLLLLLLLYLADREIERASKRDPRENRRELGRIGEEESSADGRIGRRCWEAPVRRATASVIVCVRTVELRDRKTEGSDGIENQRDREEIWFRERGKRRTNAQVVVVLHFCPSRTVEQTERGRDFRVRERERERDRGWSRGKRRRGDRWRGEQTATSVNDAGDLLQGENFEFWAIVDVFH
jgi:hypothetical protein